MLPVAIYTVDIVLWGKRFFQRVETILMLLECDSKHKENGILRYMDPIHINGPQITVKIISLSICKVI